MNKTVTAIIERVIKAVNVVLRNSAGTEIGTVANPVQTNAGSVTVGSLPAGLATSAKQDTGNASLSTLAATDFATQTTLAAVNAALTTTNSRLLDIKTATETLAADMTLTSFAVDFNADIAALQAELAKVNLHGGNPWTRFTISGTQVLHMSQIISGTYYSKSFVYSGTNITEGAWA